MSGVPFLTRPKVASTVMAHNDDLPWQHHRDAWTVFDYKSNPVVAEQFQIATTWEFGVITYGAHPIELGWDICVAAGIWKMTWNIPKRADYGIVQAKIDGVNVGPTYDAYASAHAASWSHVVRDISLTLGSHRFSIATTGNKNPSATGYLIVIEGLTLARQS